MKFGKVTSSLLYKFSERVLVKGIGLIISVILARLLSPTEFGQIALIMVFINLSIVLIDSGLNTALVQNKKTSSQDYSTVFYISLSIAIAIIVILYFSAPLIAGYYDDQTLVAPLRVYSLSLIILAANAVLVAKMQKEMRFKQMMICNLIACIISGAIGVTMAYCGYGIWALVAYYFASALITCLTLAYAAKWYPILTFSAQRAKELFSYGWKMLVSGLLCSLYYDIRSLVIGKIYTPADLGYYNRGQQFPEIISRTINNAVQSVMFPVMSEKQDDLTEVKSILRRTIGMGSFIIIPIMFGLAAVAEPFISLLLTDKWLPCVIYMQCICIGDATVPLSSSCLVAIKSVGRSDVYMKLELIRRIVMISILLISIFFFNSVLAIAVGYAVSLWIDCIVISIPINKIFNYSIIEQLSDIWKILLASIVTAGIVLFIGKLNTPILLTLILQVSIAIPAYLMLCYTLKIDNLKHIVKHIKNKNR